MSSIAGVAVVNSNGWILQEEDLAGPGGRGSGWQSAGPAAWGVPRGGRGTGWASALSVVSPAHSPPACPCLS